MRPDPAREIRMTALRSLLGANYWSRRPVTRMDLAVGAFDEISSADVPGVLESLHAALPGLAEHQCSIGERGGFLTRLRRGTYAPHIIEHVALELQRVIGHDVGYGRTRGGDAPGEYTLAFEHRHAGVGRRAAPLALHIVQESFAGTLTTAGAAIAELRALAASPDAPLPHGRVCCAITGGAWRAEAVDELRRRGLGAECEVVDLAPADILQAGVPYASAELAIIIDADPVGVPERYRERDRARRLVATVVHAMSPEGIVVVPADEREVQREARDAGCRVAVFATDGRAGGDVRGAWASASVQAGRIVLARDGERRDGGPLRAGIPPAAQLAAALSMFTLAERVRAPATERPANA